MAGPPLQVKELVERFEKNVEAYQSQTYNEAQIRLEFHLSDAKRGISKDNH